MAEILLPAMLLLGPKPAAAHAMWNLMGMFSFETRSNIYTSVTELLTQEPKQVHGWRPCHRVGLMLVRSCLVGK